MSAATWDFRTSPIAWKYRQDRSFASFIVGPVGSGKSVPSMQRFLDIGSEQEPSPDGIRRSRFALIRNTMPELRSTSAVTYQQIFPPDVFGEIIWRSPATHTIAPRGSGLEIEVTLLALDKPKDVKKLLSLELTGAYAQEVREVPRSIVTRLTERVGRFGINERATTWSGIWGDTNPPDADHWLYNWHHTSRPAGFNFHSQPPGVLEVKRVGGGVEIVDESFPELVGRRLTSAVVLAVYKRKVTQLDCPVEVIEAADRQWIVNPWHENMIALSSVTEGVNPLGARSYYGRSLAGKELAEIQSYLQGLYTFVSDGRKVIPSYNPQVHGVDHLPVMENEPIYIGADIGGGTLQPSALLFQKHPRGVLLAHREVVCFDLGIKRFGELVVDALVRHFPSHVARGLTGTGWGDPAGRKRDEIFETASFDYLRTNHGLNLEPAPSQDPRMRQAALSAPCERLIDGKPGLLVNKAGCPTLHKGLSGAWFFKRVAVGGEARYASEPAKNDYSHICDGAGYGFLGAGEFARLGGRSDKPPAINVSSDFDVFG
jgi:hypothetical protein